MNLAKKIIKKYQSLLQIKNKIIQKNKLTNYTKKTNSSKFIMQ